MFQSAKLTMIDHAEQERVKALLSQALPMLCKSGLNFSSKFSVEALIGITLDDDKVMLVSVKETIQNETGGGDSSKAKEGQNKGKRRKKSKRKHEDDSESDYTDNDGTVYYELVCTFVESLGELPNPPVIAYSTSF